LKKLSKFALILCFTGVLTLSIGFINNKDLNKTEASALLASPILVEDGDQYRVVTREEQNMRENNPIEDGDQLLVITVEEQNMVENSSALSGFVPQENGPGFFFEKVK
jgi:hypothetical protein